MEFPAGIWILLTGTTESQQPNEHATHQKQKPIMHGCIGVWSITITCYLQITYYYCIPLCHCFIIKQDISNLACHVK